MTEVFKPRENMRKSGDTWINIDQDCRYNCDGGPSVIWDDGSWIFWVDDIGFHRLDGPATSSGAWYNRGKDVTNEIHTFARENDIDLKNLTDEDKVLIALKFG